MRRIDQFQTRGRWDWEQGFGVNRPEVIPDSDQAITQWEDDPFAIFKNDPRLRQVLKLPKRDRMLNSKRKSKAAPVDPTWKKESPPLRSKDLFKALSSKANS
ncbi:MAG: hypothetical protein ACJAQT_003524 [Akkermansiaceae bacterium]|jgi:hypothetical protein